MSSLRHIIDDLDAAGKLIRLQDEVDPHLEAAEIQRRVYAAGGPAILFERVKNCRFPMASNLLGSLEQARYIFRHTYEAVKRAIELKIEPRAIFRHPLRYLSAPLTAWRMQPKRVTHGPVLAHSAAISDLPQLTSWPDDGGPFITLPQVYTEDVREPGFAKSNLGMYRVQLGGNQYAPDREIGLHYQIHRGIGVHHTAAIQNRQPFRVNIFVGGHPAMTVAAVMPLPEGMSELTFAGALAGKRIPMIRRGNELPFYADADFVICGVVDADRKLPEGPFGDHLGYYSLQHDFPVLKVEKVYHRRDAIWPFTVVGRPPQEDTTFGQLIHELTGPVISTVLAGVKEVHAVDAAGVHPLLLAIGSERYMPFHANPRPQELLTQASAILGQGQLSLAKYLWIVNQFDAPDLQLHDIPAFFEHLLRRVDWSRDLHFITNTSIDTLDYSGEGLNLGSKVVIAAAGPPIRELTREMPGTLQLPEEFSQPKLVLPGVLVVQGPKCAALGDVEVRPEVAELCRRLANQVLDQLPLVVIVDESDFAAASLKNWLWVTFTRSNPAQDLHGVQAFTRHKHWGCRGPLVIDARRKPHHAPPLIEDPAISKKVDALAARGGPIAKYL